MDTQLPSNEFTGIHVEVPAVKPKRKDQHAQNEQWKRLMYAVIVFQPGLCYKEIAQQSGVPERQAGRLLPLMVAEGVIRKGALKKTSCKRDAFTYYKCSFWERLNFRLKKLLKK